MKNIFRYLSLLLLVSLLPIALFSCSKNTDSGFSIPERAIEDDTVYKYGDYSYYIYNGKNFFEMEKEDLQLLFDKGSYNYINKRNDNPLNPTVANYEQRLPGIFENYDLELENENE